ncbi:hypothetical protein KFE98_21420 [bacterium SCSIO 12741]|nr:hypothetical protein KFE98_21420 [bacterium SCSIO 12741]
MRADLRFGMERYFSGKNKRSRFLYGLEVVGGYVRDRQEVYPSDQYYERDTVTGTIYMQGYPIPSVNSRPSYVEEHYIKTGITPILGYDLFIRNRWNLGLQISADMALLFEVDQSEVDPDNLLDPGSSNEVRTEFDVNPLNINLSFLF